MGSFIMPIALQHEWCVGLGGFQTTGPDVYPETNTVSMLLDLVPKYSKLCNKIRDLLDIVPQTPLYPPNVRNPFLVRQDLLPKRCQWGAGFLSYMGKGFRETGI